MLSSHVIYALNGVLLSLTVVLLLIDKYTLIPIALAPLLGVIFFVLTRGKQDKIVRKIRSSCQIDLLFFTIFFLSLLFLKTQGIQLTATYYILTSILSVLICYKILHQKLSKREVCLIIIQIMLLSLNLRLSHFIRLPTEYYGPDAIIHMPIVSKILDLNRVPTYNELLGSHYAFWPAFHMLITIFFRIAKLTIPMSFLLIGILEAASVIVLFAIFRKIFNDKIGLLSSLILAFGGQHVFFGSEVIPQSLSLILIALLLLVLLRTKNSALLTLIGITLLYTHPLGLAIYFILLMSYVSSSFLSYLRGNKFDFKALIVLILMLGLSLGYVRFVGAPFFREMKMYSILTINPIVTIINQIVTNLLSLTSMLIIIIIALSISNILLLRKSISNLFKKILKTKTARKCIRALLLFLALLIITKTISYFSGTGINISVSKDWVINRLGEITLLFFGTFGALLLLDTSLIKNNKITVLIATLLLVITTFIGFLIPSRTFNIFFSRTVCYIIILIAPIASLGFKKITSTKNALITLSVFFMLSFLLSASNSANWEGPLTQKTGSWRIWYQTTAENFAGEFINGIDRRRGCYIDGLFAGRQGIKCIKYPEAGTPIYVLSFLYDKTEFNKSALIIHNKFSMTEGQRPLEPIRNKLVSEEFEVMLENRYNKWYSNGVVEIFEG